MTEVTPQELRLILLQIVWVALLLIFWAAYVSDSTDTTQSYSMPSDITNDTRAASTDSSGSWISSILGDVPAEIAAIWFISAIFLVPMTLMNSFTVIRIVKDLATQWV